MLDLLRYRPEAQVQKEEWKVRTDRPAMLVQQQKEAGSNPKQGTNSQPKGEGLNMSEWDDYRDAKRGDGSTAVLCGLLAIIVVVIATALWGAPL